MKVLMENFAEKYEDQITDGDQLEQYHYKQAEQEKEEENLIKAAIEKQKGLNSFSFPQYLIFVLVPESTEVLPTMRFQAQINKLALTLYLGESDLVCN